MLWLSVSPGRTEDILHPGSPADLFNSLRSVFPFVAAYLAAMMIVFRIWRHHQRGFNLFSPLGLLAVYGLVGLVAALRSPDGSVAVRWALLYLSVPVVLWAITWGTDAAERLRRLLNYTWLALVLVALALFAVAVIYLSFFDVLSHPAQLLECTPVKWYDLTNGRLRETGVGRYAAIAAIIALSGLWQRSWRPVWFLMWVCVWRSLCSCCRSWTTSTNGTVTRSS